jgi:GNAT superfamily N-acetyltransferase
MYVKRIDPYKKSHRVAAIAEVYRRAFGGDPWNEGYRCPVCATVYSFRDSRKFCPNCAKESREVLLVEHWPLSSILSDFYREMSREGSLCLAALEDRTIIGFAWGYQVVAGPELDQHLEAPGLSVQLRPGSRYFYLAECALRPDRQGMGFGKRIFAALLRELEEGSGLLRTLNNSRMYAVAKSHGASVVQEISRDRVIMSWSRGLGAMWCK